MDEMRNLSDHPVIGVTASNITDDSPFIPRESFHVLQGENPAEILQRWANGETLKDIASSFSVTPSALTQWLDRNVPREHREQARELHYQTKLDDGLAAIEQAKDDVNLARAREPYLRRLEWRAQTECKRWQQKQHMTVEAGSDLGELLRTARQRVANTQNAPQHEPIIIEQLSSDS